MSRIKLMLVVNHLGGGGAERVLAQLARHLSPDLFDIDLVLVSHDRAGAELLPEWVRVQRLDRDRVRHAWYPLLRSVWRERPRLLISGIAHLNFMILVSKLLMPSDTRLIVRQNTTVSAAPTSLFLRCLYRCLYPLAYRIICQSQDMADDVSRTFGIDIHKVVVLHNPVDVEQIRASTRACSNLAGKAAPCSPPFPRLLAIGRLSYEKGFDLLLPAVAQLKHHFPKMKLTIAGDGIEEAALRRLSYKLNLDTVVDFVGHKTDLTDLYREATLFVLSSRYEGMPNAMLEAAAAGLPIVSTRCCLGVSNLLTTGSSSDAIWPFDTLPGTWLTQSVSIEDLADSLLSACRYLQGCEVARYEHSFLNPFERETAISAYEQALLESAAHS